MRCVAFMVLALLPLAGGGAARAAELATRETQVARLALPVVPESVVVSPDSSRVVLAAKSGDATLEEKGVFINPTRTDPRNDSARPQLNEICLYIDDRQTIAFDGTTVPVFSPDSKRLGYAGRHDKTWQLVLDGKTLMQDADEVPAVPIVFSPDSAHAAWVVKKGEQYLVTVDDRKWPPLEAAAVGTPAFSPDARHVALAARVRTGWTMFVDGVALPPPARPAASAPSTNRAGSGTQPAATVQLARFGQFAWRADSSGLAYHAAFPSATWQFFAQSLDGTIGFTSKAYDNILRGSPVFSPDGRQMAFAGATRTKWSIVTDPAPPAAATATRPSITTAAPFDQVLPESIAYYRPGGAADAPYTLLYLAQQNKKWRLYVDDRPQADTFDSIVLGSFVVSPDRQHYAFAGVRDGQTTVIRDGRVAGTHQECAADSFAFSPDSRHLAYAARASVGWAVCVDGVPGKPFEMMTNSPIAFSPDSARVAFLALTMQKTWRVIVGQDGALESKPFDAFFKGAQLTWRADGTLVTIAIQKKVAFRVEAAPSVIPEAKP